MSTADKIVSSSEFLPCPSGGGVVVGIAVAEWNKEVTHRLLDGALETLREAGVKRVELFHVPGAFELINASTRLQKEVDVVIAIGAVIRGGTPHFDYICQGVTNGLAALNRKERPIIFCVLTTDTMDDALERAGGALGNKGAEAAEAALKMVRPYRETILL